MPIVRLLPKHKTAPLRVAQTLENAEKALTAEDISALSDASLEATQDTLDFLLSKKGITECEINGKITYKIAHFSF